MSITYDVIVQNQYPSNPLTGDIRIKYSSFILSPRSFIFSVEKISDMLLMIPLKDNWPHFWDSLQYCTIPTIVRNRVSRKKGKFQWYKIAHVQYGEISNCIFGQVSFSGNGDELLNFTVPFLIEATTKLISLWLLFSTNLKLIYVISYQ